MKKLRKKLSLIVIVMLCASLLSNNIIYATGVVDVPQAEDSAETNYAVDFTLLNQWDTGYQAEITIFNSGTEEMIDWGIEFDLEQNITDMWNAVVLEQNEHHYSIQNAGWNQNIPAGGSVTFGFVADSAYTNDPVNYVLSHEVQEEEAEQEEEDKTYSETFMGEGFEVDFNVTKAWDDSYNAEIIIRNTGVEVIHNWSLEFELENTINDIWNVSVLEENDGLYVVKNMEWNQDIPVGGEILFGFTVEGEFTEFPASYTLNSQKVDVSEEDYEFGYEVVNSWDSGFTANITIQNNTDEVLEDWAVEFDFDNQIENLWNAVIAEQEGSHYILNNAGYNQNIPAGESVSIGITVQQGDADKSIENIYVMKYIIEEETELIKFMTEDSDGDGLPDYYEQYVTYTDPEKVKTDDVNHDGERDEDGDGLTNLEEYQALTNAYLSDTEYDGLSDYDEIKIYGTNPLEYDTDFDGVGDWTELQRGTDPLNPDSNGDGVTDGEETITHELCENQYAALDPDKMGYSVSITITGKGDYNDKISLTDGTGNYQFPDIEYIVGAPLYIEHDEIEFDKAEIIFTLTDKLLAENDINNLQIASYNEETHEIEFMDTQIDAQSKTVSCETTHFSFYFLVDVVKLQAYYLYEGIDTGEIISDVVFVVDTTGSMYSLIYNTQKGIIKAANLTAELGLDIKYGLVEYRDIIEDNMSSINWGWYTAEDFAKKVAELRISGGGNEPESAVDALETARLTGFRDSAFKSIVLVTDASYREETNYEDLDSMEEEIQRLIEDGISVSVLTTVYASQYYEELVERTGGQMFDANTDYSEALVEVYTSVKEAAEDYTWVRLADGTVVKLLVDPETASEEDPTDTDGDGTPDMEELIGFKTLVYGGTEYTIWKYNTNPAVNDLLGEEKADLSDAITVYEMQEGLKKITALAITKCYNEIQLNPDFYNYDSETLMYLCNTVIMQYIHMGSYDNLAWKLLTLLSEEEIYEDWADLADTQIKDDIAEEIRDYDEFDIYICNYIIDPISGGKIDWFHLNASCNAHYNHDKAFFTYPIELASWGGDLQTLAAEVAAKVSEDTLENRATVENTVEDLFLNDSSFSIEDYYADIDAVNLAVKCDNTYFVTAFKEYYLDMEVAKRHSTFLDYYGGRFESVLDAVLPERSFEDDAITVADYKELLKTLAKEAVSVSRIPFVYIQLIKERKYYLPTQFEVHFIKEYFYRYISEQSLKEL